MNFQNPRRAKFVCFNKYYLGDQTKEVEIGVVCSVNREMGKYTYFNVISWRQETASENKAQVLQWYEQYAHLKTIRCKYVTWSQHYEGFRRLDTSPVPFDRITWIWCDRKEHRVTVCSSIIVQVHIWGWVVRLKHVVNEWTKIVFQ
jgi:hypothetical protein